MDIMELAKRIMELLNGSGLRERLEKVILDGTELGRKTAFADIKIDGRTEPDFESIVRIGMRANALSDSAIARAKGNFTREVDMLYQEMDAALKAGMKKNEALGQIEERFRGLFEDSYKDWEIERLVRDQFLVATKEGRRSGWQDGGVLWRQWTMHSDSRTGDDSKRMHGQIVRIDEPYTDPLTGKKYMIEQMRPNDRCLYSSQTPILTSKGWKQVGKIEVGELVLTHKGRFRKVTETFRNSRNDGIYKITFEWKTGDNMGNWYQSLSVTKEHPLLTDEGFVLAQDLEVGQKVMMLAGRCPTCGKLMPDSRKYCNRSCASKAIATEQWKDNQELRDSNSKKCKAHFEKWNKEHPGIRKEIVKNSQKVLAAKAKIGQHPLQRPESRRALAKVLGSKKATDIEIKMEAELKKRGIDYGKQESIGKFFADFSIPEHKIAIECDGEYWHQDEEAEKIRDEKLEAEGWTVLHFKGEEIHSDINKCVDEIERVLKNHNGEYEFMECTIVNIEIICPKKPKMTYNIEVEEDHSFIAKGIVNHNCFGSPLFELPKNVTYRKGLMYASEKIQKSADVFFGVEDFLKA